ncbi:hypothetical protein Tco_0301516, partial [Tanacetum coccineum]
GPVVEGDIGEGGVGLEVASRWGVGRQSEGCAARGGECYRGSSRSAHEEHLWCWPENSPEKFSGCGRWWPAAVVAG